MRSVRVTTSAECTIRLVNGTRLGYRLERRTGRVAQIGCILAIVALLLVGEEQQRHRKTWTSRQFASINLFDSGPFEGGSAPFEGGVMFDVPRNLEPTRTKLRRRIVCHLEVWGKLSGSADLQHVYAIDVLKPTSKTLDDDHV